MKRSKAILLTILLSPLLIFGQGKVTSPAIKSSYKNYDDCIPKNWNVLKSDSGDFNEDHIQDFTFIIEADKDYLNSNGFDTKFNAPPRVLLIVFGKINTDSLDLSIAADSAIMRSNSGEGDPLAQGTGIKTDGNVFEVNYSGGISVQWTAQYRFIYKNKEWTLSYYKGTEYNTSEEESPIKVTEVDFAKKFIKQDKLKTPKSDLPKIYLDKFKPKTREIISGVIL